MQLLLDTHALVWCGRTIRSCRGLFARFSPIHHRHMRYDHLVRAGLLPGDHRDPFDRAIAAHAVMEDLAVVMRDPRIAAFGCATPW